MSPRKTARGKLRNMRTKIVVAAFTIVPLLNSLSAFGQQPAPAESHKNRTLFSIIGAGGGFTLGLLGGLAAFDDSINSDRKVWTTALVSTAAGGVGGYFLGRALDRHKSKANVTWRPNETTWSLMQYQGPVLGDDSYRDLVKQFRERQESASAPVIEAGEPDSR
jgi:hypothetical protein